MKRENKKMWNRKHLLVTETASGPIPHYRLGELDCPVRLLNVQDTQGKRFPEMRDGKFVYALPGGYSIIRSAA